MKKKSPPKSIDPDNSIFLLFHKIEQKINSILNSILEKYNIVGVWSTNIYPNNFKNFYLYNVKKILSIFYDLIIFYKCKKIY